jgi:fatty-acyl-CoA synthase
LGGLDPEPDGAVGIAFVVGESGGDPTPEELHLHLRPLLAGYKLPRRIKVLDSLPRTPGTSKVQRFRLKDLAARLLRT